MHLYLLRHANADTVADTDDERPLSEKGGQQARQVARFCARHKLKPDLILSSPLPRAEQTAKPVAEKLNVELMTAPWLASGAKPGPILEHLKEHRHRSSAMLVGHEPDLSGLIVELLGTAKRDAVLVRKASLTVIEVTDFGRGGGVLEFSLPVRLME